MLRTVRRARAHTLVPTRSVVMRIAALSEEASVLPVSQL